MAILDRFMSRWTTLVGDPVMSKWIVIALGISVFLNGYLMKGIASGSDSAFAPGSAAEAAARILLASTGISGISGDSDERNGAVGVNGNSLLKRRWSGGIEGLSELQKEWTEEDAKAMTLQHRRRSELAQHVAEENVAPELIKVVQTKKEGGEEEGEEENSPPPSPIFVRTKLRKGTIGSNGTSTNQGTAPASTSIPSLSVSTEREREIRLSPSTVALVPLGVVPDTPRSLDVCAKIFDGGVGALLLNDEEIIMLVQKGKVAAYALEKLLNDYERSVAIRRALICASFPPPSLISSRSIVRDGRC